MAPSSEPSEPQPTTQPGYDSKAAAVADYLAYQRAEGDPPMRWNWDSPLTISPHSNTRLYLGAQRLYRSDPIKALVARRMRSLV